MHTRRVGAFLIGAWLLGSLLMAFVSTQSAVGVDRFFNNPPLQVAKEVDDVGPDVMRQILRYQSAQHVRHVWETWEVIQLGLGAALLATSFLTSHRSRIVLACGIVMFLMTAFMYFYLTPLMNALARSFDFLPANAAVRERENYTHYAVWYRVLDVLKLLLALTIAGRLLFDRYEWREKLIPGSSHPDKVVRRRKRSSSGSAVAASEPPPDTKIG
jgi:hypothetical protein